MMKLKLTALALLIVIALVLARIMIFVPEIESVDIPSLRAKLIGQDVSVAVKELGPPSRVLDDEQELHYLNIIKIYPLGSMIPIYSNYVLILKFNESKIITDISSTE